MARVWIDTDIGTNPDDATALILALKHPDIDVVGISVSGTQQERRLEEAKAVLGYLGVTDVPVFLGKDVTADDINNAHLQHTVAIGPLTNIARLVLDDALIGKLHVMCGTFQAVRYRGDTVTQEKNAVIDQEATRIALTQHDNICISALDATSSLILEDGQRTVIEEKHPFLKSRFDGYVEHLEAKFGPTNKQIVLHDVLPVCDVLNTVSLVREVIEFTIQPDGSFRSVHPLSGVVEPIEEVGENPDELPVPKVKHEVIRSLNSQLVLQEVVAFL